MIVIKGRNVNELFVQGLEYLGTRGIRSSSRNGDVFVSPVPVTSVYLNPRERVLFDEKRDANPFFHLFECLWMLRGLSSGHQLDKYVANFSSRYADDGHIHGAYGYRWRYAMGFDQLNVVVDRLRRNPDDRQCVIQMWDAVYTDGQDDLRGDWKDRPCNTHIYLRVREEPITREVSSVPFNPDDEKSILPSCQMVLDLTVCCRSNDIVWGAYGANAVHFSFLQEYLAGRIGVEVGVMYQVSNNWHGYVETLDKIGDPLDLSGTDLYDDGSVWPMSIGTNFDMWDEDLRKFMEWHIGGARNPHGHEYHNNWFGDVAVPMCRANSLRRDGDMDGAIEVVKTVKALDWQAAGYEWLRRRIK